MFCKYSSYLWFLFSFSSWYLSTSKRFLFWWSLIYPLDTFKNMYTKMCLFNGLCFLCSKKSSIYPKVTKIFFCFLLEFFYLALMFMSMIYFDLIFTYDVKRSRFIPFFPHIKIQLFQHHLLKRLSSLLSYLGTFVKNRF